MVKLKHSTINEERFDYNKEIHRVLYFLAGLYFLSILIFVYDAFTLDSAVIASIGIAILGSILAFYTRFIRLEQTQTDFKTSTNIRLSNIESILNSLMTKSKSE